MELNQESSDGKYHIKAYEPGKITINDTEYTHSVIITQDSLISPWEVDNINNLNSIELARLIDFEPDVLLIGTGQKQQFLPPELQQVLFNAKIGFEIMDTAAACRTFMLLLSESRHVVAALLT